MLNSAFYRMRDEYAIALILAGFLALFLAFIPNYQKYAYRYTEPIPYSLTWKKDSIGYPAAEDFPTVESIAEIEEVKKKYFTIELDRAKLTPMDIYLYLEDNKFTSNGFMRIINNNEYGGAGRFFVAELASGEEVVVLLDDTTIDLPKEGKVRLPIGKSANVYSDKLKGELREKGDLSSVESYIDMASDWREGEEAKMIEEFRNVILSVVLIGGWILFSVLLTRLTKKEKVIEEK